MRNAGRETAYVSRCPLAYAFFDESGAYVGPYFVCAAFPTYLELAPGEKVEKRMTQVGYWAPGKYTVYAYVEGLPLQHPFAVRILPADDGIDR